MKRSLLALVGIFSLLLVAAHSFAASRVEYILDVSGSMNALSGGEKRIDAAKKAIAAMVQGIPDGSIVALRLYSHRVPPADKAASCKDTELVVPFGPINKPQFLGIVNAATPLGQTPIAYSLEQAANDFVLGADEQQTIILVSDGEESCGGDPVATAKALIAKGFKLKINVIGLDVDAMAKNQLAAIAGATGGQYFDAKDAAGLTSSLQKLTQDSLIIQKSSSVYGDEIRGGDAFETAVPLQPGKLYRLNHHQKQNQNDFFYVDAKAGQKILATLQTGEKGISIRDTTATENDNPYAGFAILGPQRTQLQRDDIIGTKNAKKEISVAVPSGGEGRYYLQVGSTYDSQNKDHPFKVDIIGQYDANTQQDAGDNEASALEITPNSYDKNFVTDTDKWDVYKWNATPGLYEIKARANNSVMADMHFVVVDSDGVQIGEATSPNPGAMARLENLNVQKPGYVYVKIEQYFLTHESEVPYTFSISQAGAAPAVAAVATPAPGTPAAPVTPVAPVAVSAAPAAPGAPVAPSVQTVTTQIASGEIKTCKMLCATIKGLPLLEKVKFFGFYSGIPLVVGWLIGWLWGYLKGRKSGKRWAARQAAKQATAPPTPPKP